MEIRWGRRTRFSAVLLTGALVAVACNPLPLVDHPAADACPVDAELWSDPATWEGAVPAEGEAPTIAHGQTVALDVDTPALAGLQIDGTLVVCRQDLTLTSDWVVVRGMLQAGTPDEPFVDDLTIELTGTDQELSVMDGGNRGIIVTGGQLRLYGDAPDVEWTRIAADVAAGSSTLQLVEPVDWEVGDEVLVTITDWYGTAETETRTITSVSGSTVEVDAPLNDSRWGVLQYVTSTGMGLAPDPSVVPAAEPTPLVLDERAEVANLSRNIVIQAPDDAAWQADGFGAHVMARDGGSLQIDGVEVRRGGQAGNLGRYPFHWHRQSYADDGTVLDDVTDQYVRSSTVVGSGNRCVTIHATNGAVVEDNVCYDIAGHGIFLEGAVERRNIISGNLIARVRNPAPANLLKLHEAGYDFGSSGMWISNPDNTVTNNTVSDAEGFGYWLAFPQYPASGSANVEMNPDRIQFGVFDGNTAHSNRRTGLMFDNAEVDAAGNVFPNQYFSTTDGQDISWPYDTLLRFSIDRFSTWKNQTGGAWSRVTVPDYAEFVSADNEDRFFAGAGANGLITRSLVVGTSLNSATPRPNPDPAPAAFATYHSAFDISDNVVVNFPLVAPSRSGMFATDDYYLRAVDKGQMRNPGNVMIDSAGGYRVPRPSPNYALAGALWDPNGIWGDPGNYFVYDEPFLTYDTTCSPVSPAGSNGVSCEGPYYGMREFVLDQGNDRWDARFPIEVSRLDDAGATVGTWSVGDGNLISAFENMRHFAALRNGRYLLDFPESPLPTDVGMTIENALTVDDTFVLGIRFDGAEPAQVYTSTYYNYFNPAHADSPSSAIKHDFTPVASLQEVVDSAGETYWQDVENDIVWMKPVGGMQQVWNDADFAPFDDELLYRGFYLRVR